MVTRERRLSETFVSLADTLVKDFDVADFFYQLVERCTELFDADQVGLVLAEPGGMLQVMAATSEVTHLIEVLQIQNEEGPCHESFRTGNPVMATDLETQKAQERWPVFAQAAAEAGFGSVAALPMRLRDQVIGALNFFRKGNEPMPPEDVTSAQAIADVATISVLQHRAVRDARVVIDQLQGALNSRIVIEQAKGVIAQHRGANMEQAFALLRGFSRDNNLLMTDVARRIVEGQIDPSYLTKTT